MDVVCRNQTDGSELLIQSRNIRAAPGSVQEYQSGTIEQAVNIAINDTSLILLFPAYDFSQDLLERENV